MSTFVNFAPSDTAPFQFQPTLNGGIQYVVVVTSNVFREDYFVNLYDLSNNLIVCRALAESGPSFQASLTWDAGTGTASLTVPHNVPVGALADLRISNTGTGFDGKYRGEAVDEMTLTFDLSADPNQPVAINGTLSFDLDLLAGYVISADNPQPIGSLYFHDETQQFEY
jgi:hypothetical protein